MANNYNKLTLQGSAASTAIDCLRTEKILPKPSLFERLFGNLDETTVSTAQAGSVTVENGGINLDASFNGEGAAAVAKTPEIQASGAPADALAKKARACVYKGAGIDP